MTTHIPFLAHYRTVLILPLVALFFSSSASALVMRENGPEPIIV